MARNSAPIRTNIPAAEKKTVIRNRTECTGFFADTTIRAATTLTRANSPKATSCKATPVYPFSPLSQAARRPPCPVFNSFAESPPVLSVGRIQFQVLRDLPLPTVAVVEQALFVEQELLAGLRGELEVRALDDGVHRAGLLAQAAVDALDHVDVVAGRAA